MVIRTRLPSFIVTLATFFVLQGVNLGVTKAITGTVRVAGLDDVPGYDERARRSSLATFWSPHNFRISVIWWIVITALATWVLTRTRVGNWIFARRRRRERGAQRRRAGRAREDRCCS